MPGRSGGGKMSRSIKKRTVEYLSIIFQGIKGGDFTQKPSWMPEANLRRIFFITILVLLVFLITRQSEKSIKEMGYEEGAEKFKEITKPKRFIETDTPQKYPWSMNEFFDRKIYEKLTGNEFFGYHYDEGVELSGNKIAIDTIEVIKGRGYEKYLVKYIGIFLSTLKAHKEYTYYVDEQARYSIGICIVSIKEKDDAESLKGVVFEAYIKDRESGKHFYHRCSTGSAGELDQAMRTSAARMIGNLQYLRKK
jgi:hypothetical protein